MSKFPTALSHAFDMIEHMDDRDMAKTLEHSLSVYCGWQTMVESFHLFYKQPLKRNLPDDSLSHMSNGRLMMRIDLIFEELLELAEASGFYLKHHGDDDILSSYITSVESLSDIQDASSQRNVIQMADAIGDIIYVCIGLAIEMGIPIGTVLREIHASNLTKADENGNPILREDGKVLKGPNYMKPQIHKMMLLRKGIES